MLSCILFAWIKLFSLCVHTVHVRANSGTAMSLWMAFHYLFVSQTTNTAICNFMARQGNHVAHAQYIIQWSFAHCGSHVRSSFADKTRLFSSMHNENSSRTVGCRDHQTHKNSFVMKIVIHCYWLDDRCEFAIFVCASLTFVQKALKCCLLLGKRKFPFALKWFIAISASISSNCLDSRQQTAISTTTCCKLFRFIVSPHSYYFLEIRMRIRQACDENKRAKIKFRSLKPDENALFSRMLCDIKSGTVEWMQQ